MYSTKSNLFWRNEKSSFEEKQEALKKAFHRAVRFGLDPSKARNINLETAVTLDSSSGQPIVNITKLVYPQSDDPNKYLILTIDGRAKVLTKKLNEMDTFTVIGKWRPDKTSNVLNAIPSYYKLDSSYVWTPEQEEEDDRTGLTV